MILLDYNDNDSSLRREPLYKKNIRINPYRERSATERATTSESSLRRAEVSAAAAEVAGRHHAAVEGRLSEGVYSVASLRDKVHRWVAAA